MAFSIGSRSGLIPGMLIGLALLAALPLKAASPEAPDLADQLSGLGRQAEQAGELDDALAFYNQALERDPTAIEVREAIDRVREAQSIVRTALRQEELQGDLGGTDLAAPTDDPFTGAEELERVQRQRIQDEVTRRLQTARRLLNQRLADAAIEQIKFTLNYIRSQDELDETLRARLIRQVEAQLLSTIQTEQRQAQDEIISEQIRQAAELRQISVNRLILNDQKVDDLMLQFEQAMKQGAFQVLEAGGTGRVLEVTAPFTEATELARQALALKPRDETPSAAIIKAQYVRYLTEALEIDALKEERFLQTMIDVERASVPFPDSYTIQYPDADEFREMSERRLNRYESVDLFAQNERTEAIYEQLERTDIRMDFGTDFETTLEDVIERIKENTRVGPFQEDGLPIQISPIGLEEVGADRQSTVEIDLIGVPLKETLRLVLDQLGLTYVVMNEGYLLIESKEAGQGRLRPQTRVYPAADLMMIPMNIGGGGGGGLGGGMGGMGGGMGGGMMGGMGGGMGGMGGGMGGMGGMGGGMMGGGMGGMGGGFRSVPPALLDADAQKKSR